MILDGILDHRIGLKALRYAALLKGFARYKNPYRRKAWKHRVEFYDRAWKEAATEVGATWRRLGPSTIEILLGEFRTFVNDNSSAIDDPVTLDLLSDKGATYQLLAEAGVPIPRHAQFSLCQMAPAKKLLDEVRRGAASAACVVKPIRGTGGGRGITSGIQTRGHMARASALAAAYCEDLLVEEQIAGDNYRLLYLDGKLIDAFVRKAPTVVGDGSSNIASLVRKANAERLAAKAAKSQVLLTIDMDMRRTLARAGLSLSSRPAIGEVVVLKTVVNENCGDDNITATRLLCPEIIETGARSVQATGIRLGGVDVITRDPALPLEKTGGVIIEVNAPPNFYYHYHKRDGAFPVAVHVLRALMQNSREKGQSNRVVATDFRN